MSVLYALGGVGKQTALGLHNTFQPSPYHHLDHEESSKLLFFYTYSFHPFKSCQQNKENGVQSMFSEYHNFVFTSSHLENDTNSNQTNFQTERENRCSEVSTPGWETVI